MSSLENHPQWNSVLKIHKTLVANGYRALIAGGAVRDLLLCRKPNDIDLATNATPSQIEELFEKTVMVGREFGVSRVILDGQDIEVATFRKDGPYLDGRKPESIEFSSEKEDALRRDFTINGLFYDPMNSEVIDHVSGQKDIMKKIIRTIGDPQNRFDEDKLRILRGIRFHGQLNFIIDTSTFEAIKRKSTDVTQVSIERIRDEWGKILMSPYALSAFEKTNESGLWGQIFPSWRFLGVEYKKFWTKTPVDSDEAWCRWFIIHNLGTLEKMGEEALRWKLPKKLIKKMIYCHQGLAQLKNIPRIEPIDIALFLAKPDSSLATALFKIIYSESVTKEWEDKMSQALLFFHEDKLAAPLVNGDDLIGYGVAPGSKIAVGLKELYRLQILKSIKSKEELLKQLTKIN